MPRSDSSYTRMIPPPVGRAARRRFDLSRLRPADLYDAWMFAEVDATLALATWRSAARPDKPAAHAAYVAALDRESHAAVVLARRLSTAR
jgi:hypothetical protein